MICFSTKRTWHKCIYTVLNLVFYEIAEWEYNNEFIIPYTDKRKKMCMHKISRYEGQGRVFCVLAVKIPIQLFSASFKYILWRFEFIIVHFMQLFILCWLNSSHNQFKLFFFIMPLGLRCCPWSKCCGMCDFRPRTVWLGHPEKREQRYPRNVINNQKYNFFTFLPGVSFTQRSRLYFTSQQPPSI